VKSCRQAKSSNNNLADSVQYLESSKEEKGKSTFDIRSTESIVAQFRQVAFGQVKEAVQSLDEWILKGDGKSQKRREEEAWNNSSVELASASLAHLRYFVIKVNADNLTSGVISISPPLKKVLFELFEMLSFTWIQQNFGDFLRHSGLRVSFNTSNSTKYTNEKDITSIILKVSHLSLLLFIYFLFRIKTFWIFKNECTTLEVVFVQ
jgi:hypothetical protein